jgi:aminoglycoside 6'-N-acetyltransferase
VSELQGDRVVLRPIQPGDESALRAIRATAEVARRWGPTEDDFPDTDAPDVTRYVAVLDGDVIGMIQYGEDPDPAYRHADIDIFLDPRHHGVGIGTDAMRTIARHLIENHGHHRLTLSTAPDNAGAIRCYEKAGFRRVGITHASEWDRATGKWVDELLMELVRPDGDPPRVHGEGTSPRAG